MNRSESSAESTIQYDRFESRNVDDGEAEEPRTPRTPPSDGNNREVDVVALEDVNIGDTTHPENGQGCLKVCKFAYSCILAQTFSYVLLYLFADTAWQNCLSLLYPWADRINCRSSHHTGSIEIQWDTSIQRWKLCKFSIRF